MSYLILNTDGFLTKDLSVVYLLLTALLSFLVVLAWRRTEKPTILIVNSYSGDIILKEAQSTFMSDARSLIKEGIQKFNGPFRIITTLGSRLILPASYIEWLKNFPDLDHQALVHDVAAPFTNAGILINVTKTKLNNQSSQCGLLHEHLTEALDKTWMDHDDWHTTDWSQHAVGFIGQMSASVFVGPELARDPKWQDLIITST
ncbi:hypothetical protein DTO013E5_9356 [Penicillium roqueforti]|uniref:uncharacterized protein n=1 Tax=Penicillium roqueforti TaxID=5082 RepID=UPI0019095F52|nr:uncharacterized protein LCP9604111_9068 [Penicillium roqueforti]KAF9239526.1 hypothetical protein LCP9604111_9068 [Penicillium roqueforti]KAI1829639.1 hypothetical protein CBS147337_9527 [Penicillium roqueforti]KAI2669993.1 hypothetical protein CBS147355_9581 [Penicillium roqueforti]KAI2671932.1 hypothetical protein LCP963914a_9563 [Penicillium roqueforti]KAI2695238.1 hypothetical protein CBS147372_9242 [Penicillium roqueforti]